MKAKVKATGEIVDVELSLEAEYHDISTNGIDEVFYGESKLDFNLDTPPKQSVYIEGIVERGLGRILYLRASKNAPAMELPKDLFPGLNYRDEPRRVRITIEEV